MMVVNRGNSKRHRRDEQDVVLQESPKRTKVHAQRKFAQGSSNVSSPALTPVKDKVKVNGVAPTPAELLPAKRPNTEDFLTFLCFRGSTLLPPRLDFFNTATVPEPQDEDGVGGSGSGAPSTSRGNSSRQDKQVSDQQMSVADVKQAKNKLPTSAQGLAAKALKKKYHEQRLAKQKQTTLAKLAQKVKGKHLVRTRASARAADIEKKRKRNARILAYNKARKALVAGTKVKPTMKRLKNKKQLRGGLRSGGQLPPGSDIGLKNPVRRSRLASPSMSLTKERQKGGDVSPAKSSPVKAGKEKVSTKPIASSLSDFSSDDDQPLVKKSKTAPHLHAQVGPSQSSPPAKAKSSAPGLNKQRSIRSKQSKAAVSAASVSTSRPSRKTKEAAALYMEMLGKDLRSPDEEYDDDTLSVESFPELPNTKKTELREKELKAMAAEKNTVKDEGKVAIRKVKGEQLIETTLTSVSPPLSKREKILKAIHNQKVEERNKRLMLRNKARSKVLKEREKVKKTKAMLAARAAKAKAAARRTSKKTGRVVEKTLATTQVPLKNQKSTAPLEVKTNANSTSVEQKKQVVEKHSSSPTRVGRTVVSPTRKPLEVLTEKPSTSRIASPTRKLSSEVSSRKHSSTVSSRGATVASPQKKSSEASEKKTTSTSAGARTDSPPRKSSPEEVTIQTPKNTRSSIAPAASVSLPHPTKQIETDDDRFSDSDEEPLRNLTAKLPKNNNTKTAATSVDNNNKTPPFNTKKEKEMSADSVKETANVLDSKKVTKQSKAKSPQRKAVTEVKKETAVKTRVASPEKSVTNAEKCDNKIKSSSVSDKAVTKKNEVKISRKIEEKISMKNVESKQMIGEKISKNKEEKTSMKNEEALQLIDEKISKKNEEKISKPIIDEKFSKKKEDKISKQVSDEKISKKNEEKMSKHMVHEKISKQVVDEKISKKTDEKITKTNDVQNSKKNDENLSKQVTDEKISKKTDEKISRLIVDGKSSKQINEEKTSRKNEENISKPVKDERFPKKSEEKIPKQIIVEKISKKQPKSKVIEASIETAPTSTTIASNAAAGASTKQTGVAVKSKVPAPILFADMVPVTKKEATEIKKEIVQESCKGHGMSKTTIDDSKTTQSKTRKVAEFKNINKSQCEATLKTNENEPKHVGIKESVHCLDKLTVTQKDLEIKDAKMAEVSTTNKFRCNKTSKDTKIGDPETKSLEITNLASVKSSKSSETLVSSSEVVAEIIGNVSKTSISSADNDENKDNLMLLTVTSLEQLKAIKREEVSVVPNLQHNVTSTPSNVDHSNAPPKLDIKQPVLETADVKPVFQMDSSKPPVIHQVDVKQVFKTDFKPLVTKTEFKPFAEKACKSDVIFVKSDAAPVSKPFPVRTSLEIPVKETTTSVHKAPAKEPPATISNSPLETVTKNEEIPTADSVTTGGANKKSRQSVNDTWRQAFINAKIPKPGQCSPVMTDEKPFVRKPFPSHALKKHINFDDGKSVEKTGNKIQDVRSKSTTSLGVNRINPFGINRKPTFLGVTTMTTTIPVTVPTTAIPVTAPTTSSLSTTTTVVMCSNDSVAVNNQLKSGNNETLVQQQSNNEDVRPSKPCEIDPDIIRLKEAEVVEDIVRRYVGGDLSEKAHKELLTGCPVSREIKSISIESANIVTPQLSSSTTLERNKQIITFTTKIIDPKPSLPVAPPPPPTLPPPLQLQPKAKVTPTTLNDSLQNSSLIDSPPVPDNIIPGGKHHNLPLPIEQLKKLGQTKSTATRKPVTPQKVLIPPPPVSLPPPTLPSAEQQPSPPVKKTQPVLQRDKDGTSTPKPSPSASGVESTMKLDLLNKKKVNMSAEEINKWLNDSTSAGIEHAKDCGIFEKNECECKPSFVEDKDVELLPPPLTAEIVPKGLVAGSKPEVKCVAEAETLSKLPLLAKISATTGSTQQNAEGSKLPTDKLKQNVENRVKGRADKPPSLVGMLAVLPTTVKTISTTASSKSSESPEVPQQFQQKITTLKDDIGSREENRSGVLPLEPFGPTSSSKSNWSLKVSRGTNKMGDSEAENSSRDPSEVSSPPPRDDISSNDESPDKFAHPEQRRSIFHQRRSASFRMKPPPSRSPSAFSPENESSVYAFEPDLPAASAPFRRAKSSKEVRLIAATSTEEEGSPSSASIAVQVNLDNEALLECSTQTEADDDDSEGHLFYIPLQRNAAETNLVGQELIQGVAVKLGTEGPDQRFIMRAKFVTKPPSTYASTSSSRSLVNRRESIGVGVKPEQKVKPLTSNMHGARPPVGSVQPTPRVSTTTTTGTANPVLDNMRQGMEPPAGEQLRTAVTFVGKEVSTGTSEIFCEPSPINVDKKTVKDSSTGSDIKQKSPTETEREIVPSVNVEKRALEKERGVKSEGSNSPIPDKRRKVTAPAPAVVEKTVRKASAAVAEKTRRSSPAPGPNSKTRKFSPAAETAKERKAAAERNLPSTSGKQKRVKGKAGGGSSDHGAGDGFANLKEAPSFYPTEKEFQDPLEYIDKIRPLAEKFGLCRVIPPPNFKPECKVSDDMRFTAYNQYVHKTMHRWGPNVKEMLAIKKYLATQSISLTHPPWIGGMEVDLPKLYQTVQNCGGLKEVIEKKRWTRVADAMRIPKSAQDRVTKLDDIYCKFLLPYDTLSHEERTKLFEDVEADWEKRLADDNDTDSNDDSSDLDECIVKGRNMALNAFYRIARNSMAVYFRNDQPSANEVEAEFWNHVSSRHSHVCVHSGSIDSGAFGYGFPIAKNSSTARHPWNLKVLTNNTGSILRSLGPLMGVTVPTLHVGMVFSSCCWYRDPHGLPWIEYLHTGASKIWYGIPDDSSSSFREAMVETVPRLCRDKTIWLASDTAMVPPQLLVNRGVSLCRTVQHPGQFIIVFPKAFTSSICTGYLVSESVYFAQPSWLTTAHNVFKDISDSSEPSMFSLERLLFSIASDARSHLDVLSQVLPMVESIKEREVAQRTELEKLGLTTSERLPLNKSRGKSRLAHDDDSDYECEICRANLFLSLVTNSHEEGVYCLRHAIQLLTSKPSDLKYCSLLYTYSSEEFDELIEKIKTRIETKSQKKVQNRTPYSVPSSLTASVSSFGASSKS